MSKTPEQRADEYLLHRTTYTDEVDLAAKRRKRLTSFFESAMADARRAALEEAVALVEGLVLGSFSHHARTVIADKLRAMLDDAGKCKACGGTGALNPGSFGSFVPCGECR